jgi:dihydrofolate reductase
LRKVTFGVANSLDNYIARPDGAVDWLLWCKEVNEIMSAYWKTIDTVLMGRKTYEVALAQSKGKKNPSFGVKTYVFSSTLEESSHKTVEIVREDAVSFTRKLKGEEGKDICLMGGGELAKAMFEAKLIDEIGFNIHPVLLGQGIPLFHEMNRQINLELLDCKTLQNGCVVVSYRVRN